MSCCLASHKESIRKRKILLRNWGRRRESFFALFFFLVFGLCLFPFSLLDKGTAAYEKKLDYYPT